MRHPALYEKMRALADIPRAEWLKAERAGTQRTFRKSEHFIRPGDPADSFGLVISGLFRAYRVSARGDESVKAFRAEFELIGAYAELLQRVKSLTAIEALEPSQALIFRTGDFEALEAGHFCWTRLARRIAETQFILKERREQEFLDLSAEERFDQFWADHAHLQGRLPQREVALYLGVTEVALSRIVSRRRKQSGR